MDVLEFVKQHKRMCESVNCTRCPLKDSGPSCCKLESVTEKTVKAVEDWAAAHPAKTRQSEFLKQWPDTMLDPKGILDICPIQLAKEYRQRKCGTNCDACRRKFWLKEVE